VVFEKLPQGVYAATVLHDEKLVGKMEFDSEGTPLEGYGISNNPDSSEGPPTFDESKFSVNLPDAAIEIAMTYCSEVPAFHSCRRIPLVLRTYPQIVAPVSRPAVLAAS